MRNDLLQAPVDAVMTASPKTVRPDQLASEALQLLNSSKNHGADRRRSGPAGRHRAFPRSVARRRGVMRALIEHDLSSATTGGHFSGSCSNTVRRAPRWNRRRQIAARATLRRSLGRLDRFSGRGRRRRRGLEHRLDGDGRSVGAVCGRQYILIGLPVGDELLIARSAGPRRHIARHAAGPMRPMVGDIGGESVFGSPAGARAKRQPGPYHDRRRDKAPDDQGAARAGRSCSNFASRAVCRFFRAQRGSLAAPPCQCFALQELVRRMRF